jgi:hypothetical protein
MGSGLQELAFDLRGERLRETFELRRAEPSVMLLKNSGSKASRADVTSGSDVAPSRALTSFLYAATC